MTIYIVEKDYGTSIKNGRLGIPIISCLPEQIWRRDRINITSMGQQFAQYLDRFNGTHYDSEVFWNQKRKEEEELLK